MKVQELHDEIMKTEELILFLKNMEDENEFRSTLEMLKDYASKGWATLLSSIAIHYLNIIRNIGHETRDKAKLKMVRNKLKNEFENQKTKKN